MIFLQLHHDQVKINQVGKQDTYVKVFLATSVKDSHLRGNDELLHRKDKSPSHPRENEDPFFDHSSKPLDYRMRENDDQWILL